MARPLNPTENSSTQTFAEQFRLRVKREMDDKGRVLDNGALVIPGRWGELYFDGPELCLIMLNAPVRAKSVLKAIGGKLSIGDKSPDVMHLYRGAPAVRCWSKYQQTDKGITLCAVHLRRDSKGRSHATEEPRKVSCPYCVELLHPQACREALVPCGFCTGIITRPKPNGDVQDVRISAIPLENARLAIRLVGARPRRVLSEVHRKALVTGGAATRIKSKADGSNSPHGGQPAASMPRW